MPFCRLKLRTDTNISLYLYVFKHKIRNIYNKNILFSNMYIPEIRRTAMENVHTENTNVVIVNMKTV